MINRKLIHSQVYATVIRCDDCKAIKTLDGVYLYRFDAQKKLDTLPLQSGEMGEIIVCPLK